MIGEPEIGSLPGAVLSAVAHEGLTATTPEGKPARLAVLDEDGRVLEVGDAVAREAMAVAIKCYRNFLQGQGYLKVTTG